MVHIVSVFPFFKGSYLKTGAQDPFWTNSKVVKVFYYVSNFTVWKEERKHDFFPTTNFFLLVLPIFLLPFFFLYEFRQVRLTGN